MKVVGVVDVTAMLCDVFVVWLMHGGMSPVTLTGQNTCIVNIIHTLYVPRTVARARVLCRIRWSFG